MNAFFSLGGIMKNPLKTLSAFELALWSLSALTVTLSFLLSPERDILTLISSLIGVSALIFVAKGHLLGQVLTIVFALFYGIISFYFKYYGEMITYLGMTAPSAFAALISWIKHQYKRSSEVEVRPLSKKDVFAVFGLCALVTLIFYFLLKALGTASLAVSTFSVATSFLASFLTILRSPYYAVAYAANDIILIILWIIAAISDISCLPMVACFVAFFANDIYGFFNWKRMRQRQRSS